MNFEDAARMFTCSPLLKIRNAQFTNAILSRLRFAMPASGLEMHGQSAQYFLQGSTRDPWLKTPMAGLIGRIMGGQFAPLCPGTQNPKYAIGCVYDSPGNLPAAAESAAADSRNAAFPGPGPASCSVRAHPGAGFDNDRFPPLTA